MLYESPPQVVASPLQSRRTVELGRWPAFLHRTIFFFLALFVILLPHSVKGARHAWMAAFWVWLLSLVIERRRIFAQPLVLPMLAFIALSGISTALSPDPELSWGYMKLVCYIALVGTVVAQNLKRISEVRILMLLLLLSATGAAAYTAWQYTYGIGVKVNSLAAGTPLHEAGLRPGDVVISFDGHSLHKPDELTHASSQAPAGSVAVVNFLRGLPPHRYQTEFRIMPGRSQLTSLQLSVARPVRAQGSFRHYGIFAEVLMPIACLAWAFVLGYMREQRWLGAVYAFIFLALTAAIFATQTRAAIAGLLAGCAVSLLLLARRRARIWTICLLVLLAIGATLWIHHTRGLGWISARDAGTQYRWLMWEDGVRLAAQHPFFGVGMATVQNHWRELNMRAFGLYGLYYNFHSDIVQIAAERGLLALAAWIWFVVAYLLYLLRLFHKARRHNRFAAVAVAGILSGFVAFLFPSLVESALNDDSLVMLLFFCFGAAVALDRLLDEPAALDVT
jgi:hypothetical protein